MKKKTYACLQTALHISHLCAHNFSPFREYILFYFLVEEGIPERKPFTQYNSGKDKALYLGHWRVNTVWLCYLNMPLLPEDTNIHLLNACMLVSLEFTVVVFESNILKCYWSMVCFYTFSMKCPLLRFSSLQPSPALKNLYSLTPAQPTTRTMRPPFPSQSLRQLCPAYPCRNNHWKRGRRGRRRERKWGKRCQQSRGRSWQRRGRQVTTRRPRARARHVWYAARVVTLTRSNRKGGQETRSLFKKEEVSVAATNPGPLTWGNHIQVWNSCKHRFTCADTHTHTHRYHTLVLNGEYIQYTFFSVLDVLYVDAFIPFTLLLYLLPYLLSNLHIHSLTSIYELHECIYHND